MTSKELVGPVRTLLMRDGTRLTVEVPQNTLDPRYMLCTSHHTGCDCYEAERNENVSEYQAMWDMARDAARDVLAGHRTFPDTYMYIRDHNGAWDYVWDPDAVCSCTGCQIARKAYLR